MKNIVIPERTVHPTELLVESTHKIHAVWLALHAESGLIDNEALESTRNTLWEAMDQLRTVLAAA